MNKKVLIAEDQPDSRKLLEDVLSLFVPHGVMILTARDGQEAYDLIQQERPDVLLLDIMMPRMSGIQVCQHVKDDPDLQHAHVIMVSAMLHADERHDAIRAGADECVPKPFDVHVIVDRVQTALDLAL